MHNGLNIPYIVQLPTCFVWNEIISERIWQVPPTPGVTQVVREKCRSKCKRGTRKNNTWMIILSTKMCYGTQNEGRCANVAKQINYNNLPIWNMMIQLSRMLYVYFDKNPVLIWKTAVQYYKNFTWSALPLENVSLRVSNLMCLNLASLDALVIIFRTCCKPSWPKYTTVRKTRRSWRRITVTSLSINPRNVSVLPDRGRTMLICCGSMRTDVILIAMVERKDKDILAEEK